MFHHLLAAMMGEHSIKLPNGELKNIATAAALRRTEVGGGGSVASPETQYRMLESESYWALSILTNGANQHY